MVFLYREQFNTAKNLERIKSAAESALAPANLGALDLDGLGQRRAEYKKKLLFIQELIASRTYLTMSFNVLPKATVGPVYGLSSLTSWLR